MRPEDVISRGAAMLHNFEKKNPWPSSFPIGAKVRLNYRLFKGNGVLRLCNVPEAIMKQLQVNQLVKVLHIYPNLEAALKSDERAARRQPRALTTDGTD